MPSPSSVRLLVVGFRVLMFLLLNASSYFSLMVFVVGFYGEFVDCVKVIRGVQTGGFSLGFGGKTSRSFDAKTSRKHPCIETSPEVLLLFL
jgi:hypothetical protein